MEIEMLPEGCISTIIFLTSPSDAFSSSMVSSTFRSAAESDVVWERFLPHDVHDILSRSVVPLRFHSKKDLFCRLCRPLLIDGGSKSFKLEPSSGKVTYTLSARELSITWSNDPLYWAWKPMSDTRFKEAVELRITSWLEIHGKVTTKTLSPNTLYGAYLIMNISNRSYGLDSRPCEVLVRVGDHVSSGTVYLRNEDKRKQQMECLFYGNRMEALRKSVIEGNPRVPRKRPEDAWVEIELGEFFSGEGGDEEVKMSLMEVKGYQLKAGLIIEGIEVRPKHV